MSKNILIEAMDLLKTGYLEEAKKKYTELLLIDNENFDAYYFLGRIAYDQKNYEQGVDLIKKAIQINISVPEAYICLGLLFKELEDYNESIKNLEAAINLNKKNFEAYVNLGIVLIIQARYEEAVKNFKIASDLKKDHSAPFSNIGFCLLLLGRPKDALLFLNKAISLDSHSAQSYVNRAIVKEQLNEFDAALSDFDIAISLNSSLPEYYYERGLFFQNRKNFLRAIKDFEYAYFLNPNYKDVLGLILLLSCRLSDFKRIKKAKDQILLDIKKNLITFQPFEFLLVSDQVDLHFKIAKNFSKSIDKKTNIIKKFDFCKIKNRKIKVAYFSSDIEEHPVSRQIVELFELHDRSNFEIFLFSLKKHPESLLRNRVIKSCDHFIDVGEKPYLEIVNLARGLNIDIAVDLNGNTNFNKTEIFCCRVAPIQINYLAYPATSGVDFMDYIVADKIVIHKKYMEKYSEKIVYLPNSYQVNDRLKKISEQKLTRSDFGLKDDQFVFCCFSMVYKITEEIFKTWMNILNKVPNSVLWLLEPNEIAKNNLIKEFEKNGISSTRVSFLKFLENSVYLATHRLADLFLDTFPYNAHSTASESLWAGLPLLTLTGKSFHSRVAASILNAINLPELITSSLDEYEKLAIELALNPQKLKNIKNKLNSNIKTAPLFDTPLYTKNLESAYKQMYKRYQLDQKPDHIYINE